VDIPAFVKTAMLAVLLYTWR